MEKQGATQIAPLFLYEDIHIDLTNYEIKLRDTFQLFLVTDKYAT